MTSLADPYLIAVRQRQICLLLETRECFQQLLCATLNILVLTLMVQTTTTTDDPRVKLRNSLLSGSHVHVEFFSILACMSNTPMDDILLLTQHSPERFTGCMSSASVETSPTACAKRTQRLGEVERYICYSCLVAVSMHAAIRLLEFNVYKAST
jgi:hypothetical protein